MFKHIVSLSLASMFCAGFAFAELPGDKDSNEPKAKIVFEEMVARCAQSKSAIGDFRQIVPPKDLVITCIERSVDFEPAQPGSVPFNNQRWVTAEMSSNKFEVVENTREFPVNAQNAGVCPVYRQVMWTYPIEHQTSCAEILAFTSAVGKDGRSPDQNDFCAKVIGENKGKNSKLASKQATGVLINTCGGSVPTKDGKPVF